MKKEENPVYYLVLEARPGEFMPIDINILLNNNSFVNYNSIEMIDSFTKNYTYDEIMNLIRLNNLVTDNFYEGTLEIINQNKYRYKVLTKENVLSLDIFFIENINNKVIMNKFINIYHKYSKDDLAFMKSLIETKNINGILNEIYKLGYLNLRNIYLYLDSIKINNEEKRVLKQND